MKKKTFIIVFLCVALFFSITRFLHGTISLISNINTYKEYYTVIPEHILDMYKINIVNLVRDFIIIVSLFIVLWLFCAQKTLERLNKFYQKLLVKKQEKQEKKKQRKIEKLKRKLENLKKE